MAETSSSIFKSYSVHEDQLKWFEVPLVEGGKAAVLFGDPAKAGTVVLRFKFPPNRKTRPHRHPYAEYAVKSRRTASPCHRKHIQPLSLTYVAAPSPLSAHTATITARFAASIGDENALALPPSSDGKEHAMKIKRRRFKQTQSLKDRLAAFAKEAREAAMRLPAGSVRDSLLHKARQADIALHLDEWANSAGLRPPE